MIARNCHGHSEVQGCRETKCRWVFKDLESVVGEASHVFNEGLILATIKYKDHVYAYVLDVV